MEKIEAFQGEFRFLSNFYPSPITIGKITFPTVEHAFQAAKTNIPAERKLIIEAKTPGEAKRLGRKVTKRDDWDEVKLYVMEFLVTLKFKQNQELREMLILTHPYELEEGNTWGDTFWGTCNGDGQNWLGTILMQVRKDFIEWSRVAID